MKVRVVESFNTAKGIISEGTIIEITDALFDRLQGKVARIPPAETRTPLSEGRRETLAAVADAILEQAVIDIQNGGIWHSIPDIEVLEDEINLFYKLLMEGITNLEKFRQVVEKWKMTGTQTIKH